MRVEIPVFAGQLLVDDVGDHVRDLPDAFVLRREFILDAGDLSLFEHVPQPEIRLQPAIRFGRDRAGDQRLRIQHLPVGEARLIRRFLRRLDEGGRIERPEHARIAQIARHDLRDRLADLRTRAILALQGGDRDGQRRQICRCHIDCDLRLDRGHGEERANHDQRPSESGAPAYVRHCPSISLGSK